MKRFCILAFFLFSLFDLSACFGQVFNAVADSTVYPAPENGAIIPQTSNQAILVWRREPRGGSIVSAEIVPSVTFGEGENAPDSITTFGWAYREGVAGESGFDIFYTICDASTLYLRSGSLSSYTLNFIQQELERKDLGTVAERRARIASFQLAPIKLIDVNAIFGDMLKVLQPWVTTFLGIGLTLFVVDVFSSRSKRLIASANRIKMRKERAEERRQIRNDQTAQVYEVRLDWLARVRSGAVSDPNISPRQARRMFEDAAYDYAEYRRSRGWKY